MNRLLRRDPQANPMEFPFHNRLFRPASPPVRRAVIQTGVSLCSVRRKSPPLFSTSRPRRSSTAGDITDYFVRPRSPFRPAFTPSSADHPCRTDSGPDRGHKDTDICDGHRDAMTCAIRHAGPLPRRLCCTSRLRLSVSLAGASLRFSFFPFAHPVSLPVSPSLIALCGAASRARASLPRSVRPARLRTKGGRGAQGTALRAERGRRGGRRG